MRGLPVIVYLFINVIVVNLEVTMDNVFLESLVLF
jgi:hypothetical protein